MSSTTSVPVVLRHRVSDSLKTLLDPGPRYRTFIQKRGIPLTTRRFARYMLYIVSAQRSARRPGGLQVTITTTRTALSHAAVRVNMTQLLRTSLSDSPRDNQNTPNLASMHTNPVGESARLTGWKEIGNFVGRGVRTVQRWTTELELPVHRIRNSPRSPVFAFKSELDWWMRKRAMDNGSTHQLVPHQYQTSFTIRKARLLKTRCRSLNVDLHQQLQCLMQNLDSLRALTGKSPSPQSTLDSGYGIASPQVARATLKSTKPSGMAASSNVGREQSAVGQFS